MIRVIACLLLSFSPIAVFAETGKIDFNRDVRPVLSENCFHCHGPDSTTRQADLRLDLAESAMTVVDTDDPESSELIR
ncbi:MAG: c-type cytochrome domain-containing protein, partial [Rubripirellula sp.]